MFLYLKRFNLNQIISNYRKSRAHELTNYLLFSPPGSGETPPSLQLELPLSLTLQLLSSSLAFTLPFELALAFKEPDEHNERTYKDKLTHFLQNTPI